MPSSFAGQLEREPDRPLISIIVPTLVADRELDRCLASIELVCPDRSECEVILVVPAAIAPTVAQTYPAFRVVTDTRKGIYAAMNDGTKAAKGLHLYYIGKDDILLPPFAEALRLLNRVNPVTLFGDVYWGDQGVYSGAPSKYRLIGRNLCHQGIIYARPAFDRHGPYLRRMRLQADHLLNLKILWDAQGPQSLYLNRPVAWYSGSGFSVVRGADPVFWRLYPTVLRRYVGAWAAVALTLYRKARGV